MAPPGVPPVGTTGSSAPMRAISTRVGTALAATGGRVAGLVATGPVLGPADPIGVVAVVAGFGAPRAASAAAASVMRFGPKPASSAYTTAPVRRVAARIATTLPRPWRKDMLRW